MKIIVPAGFMPMVSGGTITIEICRGFDSEPMSMAVPGMAAHEGKTDHRSADHAGRDMPCAFSGLLAPAIGGADALLLAALVAAIVASGVWARTALSERLTRHLRPPLRGPPART